MKDSPSIDLAWKAPLETGMKTAISLAPDYLRLVSRLEALAANASGADKRWVHRAHEEALRHLNSARLRH